MDEFKPVYDRVQRIESFHTLAFDAGITQIIESLLGPEVLLQPSNIARFIFPTLARAHHPAAPGLPPHPGHRKDLDDVAPPRRLPPHDGGA